MGRRNLVFIAPSQHRTHRVSRHQDNHRHSSSSRHQSHSQSRHGYLYSHSCEESDGYDSEDDDSSCERVPHPRRAIVTRKVYRPVVRGQSYEPEVYYSTTLKALRDRENARIDGMRGKRSVLSIHRDLNPSHWFPIWDRGNLDIDLDEMQRRFNHVSIADCKSEDLLWTDDDCMCGHGRCGRCNLDHEGTLDVRWDGELRSHSKNAHGGRSRSRSRTRSRHGYKTIKDNSRSDIPIGSTQCRHDGTFQAVMSGACDPRDSVAAHEWRRAALSQDDGGVWHEYGHRDEGSVARTVGYDSGFGEQCEDLGQRSWDRSERWRDRAQPVGFIEELDWS